MKFSILIPVYNVEKYIDECLKSVISQTYKDFEVIITDDGSTDSSGLICDKYEKDYPFIKVIHQKNTGLIGARRTGLAVAQGEYIVFLDSDDFVSEVLLESLAKVLEKKDYDMVLYNAYKYINGKTSEHKPPLFDHDKEFDGNIDEIINALLLRKLANSLCTKAVKRTIIDIERDYTEYYQVALGEDLLQLLPIISKAQSAYYLNKMLYYYRTNLSSLTQNYKSTNYDSLRTVNKVLDEYCSRWGKNEFIRYTGYRYLVDVYAVLGQIARTPFGFDKKKEISSIRNDPYFQKKYEEADKTLLSKQQKIMLQLADRQDYLLLYPYMWIYKLYIYCKNRR